jgi:hypothetical protein
LCHDAQPSSADGEAIENLTSLTYGHGAKARLQNSAADPAGLPILDRSTMTVADEATGGGAGQIAIAVLPSPPSDPTSVAEALKAKGLHRPRSNA